MYDNILYPTDGSTGSDAAAEHARLLASTFGATVHVLHVVDTRHTGIGVSGAFLSDDGSGLSGKTDEGDGSGTVGERRDFDEEDDAQAGRGAELVEEAAAAFGDVETVTAVESGNPHSVIVDYADANDVDLIVMGTHGRTGVDRYLLGSVTEKVVRLADPPVMTVRADADG
ncbi:universal stress protein [Halorubrum sp. JWXQ-INN 858]|uniref:universal stress protein n=1 Tax=Halorubrum sp. JWXQ-INN 858 TaxID=2690782 RepID=UPI00135A6E7E|nr:universal stress protein [Halorubrum sp. JWXQ-INN 858]MWV65002.1 universal stress protein [Halorubrum sp. JWXQ-INN 858]